MSRGESFLGRWARLKEEAQRPPPPAPEPLEEDVAPAPPEVPETPDRPGDQDEVLPDLPDVETLDASSDYTAFLDPRVPEETQRQALRKLWASDPSFNIRDGLDDYDDDYRLVGRVGAAVRTAYDVVRGYTPPEEEGEISEERVADGKVNDEEGGVDGESSSGDAASHNSRSCDDGNSLT